MDWQLVIYSVSGVWMNKYSFNYDDTSRHMISVLLLYILWDDSCQQVVFVCDKIY